jgi:hypothetical protein
MQPCWKHAQDYKAALENQPVARANPVQLVLFALLSPPIHLARQRHVLHTLP